MCEALLFDSASSVMVGSHVIRSAVKITEHYMKVCMYNVK